MSQEGGEYNIEYFEGSLVQYACSLLKFGNLFSLRASGVIQSLLAAEKYVTRIYFKLCQLHFSTDRREDERDIVCLCH